MVVDNKKLEETKKKHRTKAENRKIGKAICKKYSEGKYTIASICESYGVPYSTFRYWIKDWESEGYDKPQKGYIAEVAEAYKKAKASSHTERSDRLREGAWIGLEKKVAGYDYEELQSEMKERLNGSGEKVLVPVGVKKTKKHVPPSDTAIIFTLKNLVPETFSDTIVQEHKGEIARPHKDLTDEELDEQLAFYEGKIDEAKEITDNFKQKEEKPEKEEEDKKED